MLAASIVSQQAVVRLKQRRLDKLQAAAQQASEQGAQQGAQEGGQEGRGQGERQAGRAPQPDIMAAWKWGEC